MERKMDWQQLLVEKRYNTSNIFYLRGESAYNIDSMNIIKSEAFQKLPEKTHIFPLESWECCRTSMVHSLEVSYFSKMIVHKFAERNMRKSLSLKEIAKMSNTVSAVGLMQEIGLPAFGYCGEAAMRAWFQAYLVGFTYNGRPVVDWLGEQQRRDLEHLNIQAQSLRIVRHLHDEKLRKKLNLTYPILNTMLKLSLRPSKKRKQSHLDHYQSEQQFYRNVSDEMGVINQHPLTLIVQAASDIARTTSTIKEAIGKGLINTREIVSYLQNKIDDSKLTYGQLYQYRELLGQRTHYLYKEEQDESAVLLWIEDLQLRFIINAASSFNKKHTTIMTGDYRHDLFYETDVEPLMRGLEGFVEEQIICHSQLQKSEQIGRECIFDLLKRFVPAVIYFEEERTEEERVVNMHLSTQVKHLYHADLEGYKKPSQGDKLYHRLLMVVDFLTELTDEQALRLSEKLMGFEVINR